MALMARGRPRDELADEAILRSTVRLLAERGFERMTLAAVAEDAGVSTATVHRRYSTKSELAIAAMAWVRAETEVPSSGDLAADLEAIVRQVWVGLTEHLGMGLIGAVLVQERECPELTQLFRERIALPRVELIAAVLIEGQRRGEVSNNADLDVAAELLIGAVFARYLTGKPPPIGWFRSVAESVHAAVQR